MKVYLKPQPEALSRALTRVESALAKYKPDSVMLVDRVEDADLVVHHVIGREQRDMALDDTLMRGRRVAIIQYCLKSTDIPDVQDWLPAWEQANLVWSYYDLDPLRGARAFYYAPLGVDTTVFKMPTRQKPREWLLATTGYVAEPECLQECADAVKALGGRMLHLGHDKVNLGDHVDYVLNITDTTWARLLGQCQFVAGLRRIEGFELPLLEGYACGAAPITFDRPHYRQWFGEMARLVPEVTPRDLTSHLVQILATGARLKPISSDERQERLRPFNWETICRGFWERLV